MCVRAFTSGGGLATPGRVIAAGLNLPVFVNVEIPVSGHEPDHWRLTAVPGRVDVTRWLIISRSYSANMTNCRAIIRPGTVLKIDTLRDAYQSFFVGL